MEDDAAVSLILIEISASKFSVILHLSRKSLPCRVRCQELPRMPEISYDAILECYFPVCFFFSIQTFKNIIA